MSRFHAPNGGVDAKKILSTLSSGDHSIVDLCELSAHLWNVFGGAEGLARCIRRVHDDANDGSTTRAKILSDVIGMLQKHADVQDEYDLVDDETMDALDQLIPKDTALEDDGPDEPD